jgi:hypothetical protein
MSSKKIIIQFYLKFHAILGPWQKSICDLKFLNSIQEHYMYDENTSGEVHTNILSCIVVGGWCGLVD